MKHFTFAYPWLLILLPLLPLVYLRWRKLFASNYFLSSDVTAIPSTHWKTRLRKYLPALPLIGALLAILALARPQAHNITQTLDGRGIDIVLSIDISGSMLSKDFEPNRLEAAKQTAQTFIIQRPADRIGIVIFSGESFTLCPPTLDKNVLSQHLNTIQSGQLEMGTAIGMGLATAVDKLKESKAKSKVIILMTDGVNNGGIVDPITALEIAKTFGIKVYTIGVGSKGKALTPVRVDAFGEWVFEYEDVEIDEALMNTIASSTGGKYFRATDNTALNEIYKEIDQLEKSDIKVKTFIQKKELFTAPLGVALFFLMVYLLLRYTLLRSMTE
jgi:Ca-activated chloride channel family protein